MVLHLLLLRVPVPISMAEALAKLREERVRLVGGWSQQVPLTSSPGTEDSLADSETLRKRLGKLSCRLQ